MRFQKLENVSTLQYSGTLLQLVRLLLERSASVQQQMLQSNGFTVISYYLMKVFCFLLFLVESGAKNFAPPSISLFFQLNVVP